MKINIKKEDINLDNCVDANQVLQNFVNYIIKILTEYKVDYIITNGNIASCLQDSIYFNFEPQKSLIGLVHNGEPYIIGNLCDKQLYDKNIVKIKIIKDNGINIFVDPYIKWNDNIIKTMYDKSTLTSFKINKINNSEYIELLEEINVDNEIVDKMI